MIQKSFAIFTLTCLLLLGSLGLQSSHTNAQSVSTQTIENPTKPWTISFNAPVSGEPENLQLIYIQTADNKKHEVSIQISADSKKVTVKPKISYHFGQTYTLVIPKDFQSSNGKKLKATVTKQFQLQGKVIADITAIANPFLTNIIVKGTSDMTKVTYSIHGSVEQALIRNGNQFSRGQQGLAKGDFLTIHAYNTQEKLLETQTYEVN